MFKDAAPCLMQVAVFFFLYLFSNFKIDQPMLNWAQLSIQAKRGIKNLEFSCISVVYPDDGHSRILKCLLHPLWCSL